MNDTEHIMLKVDNVSKQYRLGAIGGGTLKGDLQSYFAKIRGKADPNLKIGMEDHTANEVFMALQDISFEIKKGERVGIIGHNGAGKSTLLKLLSRVTAPTKGAICLDGRIASMLEVGTGFHPELTGRENVYMNGAILGMTRAEIDKKFDDIVHFAEMEKFIDTPVKRYSSGMYVKLAFSVAAHLDSEIMIMDEVLAVGDMKFQQKCLNKMNDVSKKDGRTILYVSHNMSTIRQLCNRCIVLDHGKLIFDGDVNEAIRIYMGDLAEVKTDYCYNLERECYRNLPDRFLISECHLLNTKDCIYQIGDKIELLLKSIVRQKIDGVMLRFSVVYTDNSLAGIMMMDEEMNFEAGIYDIPITLELTHIMPGKYEINIIVYQHDQIGNQLYIDQVIPAFYFEIRGKITEYHHLVWKHEYYGHNRLHDIQVHQITKNIVNE